MNILNQIIYMIPSVKKIMLYSSMAALALTVSCKNEKQAEEEKEELEKKLYQKQKMEQN